MRGIDGRTHKAGGWRAGRGVLFAVGVLALSGCLTSRVPQPSAEYREKAAFLYHFGQFVEWPTYAFSSPTAPLVIGVWGGNPFGYELENLVNRQNINGHPLVVQRLDSLAGLKGCHILFIHPSEKTRLPPIFSALQGGPVLTVSEADHFLAAGGMINFVKADGKVRFEINQAAAQRAGLKISSQLLILAVRTEPGS